jgi:hypothetical protein
MVWYTINSGSEVASHTLEVKIMGRNLVKAPILAGHQMPFLAVVRGKYTATHTNRQNKRTTVRFSRTGTFSLRAFCQFLSQRDIWRYRKLPLEEWW